MLQFEVHIVKFSGALFEFCFFEVFKRVSKKSMMSWFMKIFYPIFGIYGTFYDLCYASLDPKMFSRGGNIELKYQFLMYLGK